MRTPAEVQVRLGGLITALVTPFRPNGRLDRRTLEEMLERQVAAGVDGLVVCGSTGEGLSLEQHETETVISVAVQVAARSRKGGRSTLIIAGAGAPSTAGAAELVTRAAAVGADAALVVAPFYQRPTQGGLARHFVSIADEEQLPIIVYNSPDRTGCNIEQATVELLSHHPAIIGYKEASSDFHQALALGALASGELRLLVGRDPFAAPLLMLGWDGVVSVSANVVPHLMRRLVVACRTDPTLARTLHAQLLGLMTAGRSDANPVPIKAALAMLGWTTDIVRPPLTPLDPDRRAELRAVLGRIVPAGALTPGEQRRLQTSTARSRASRGIGRDNAGKAQLPG